MKKQLIRVSGKRIFANDDELEEGHVEIELPAYDILREIDSDDVADYARWSLDMRHEDDFESDLDDFDDEDLILHLDNNGYNFSKLIDEDDCIEFLEDSGYIVTYGNEVEDNLDAVDDNMLEEIKERFLNGSWQQRQEMYNLIKSI